MPLGRPWTYEEDCVIYTLSRLGYSKREITTYLEGRSMGAISQRMTRRGLCTHPPAKPGDGTAGLTAKMIFDRIMNKEE